MALTWELWRDPETGAAYEIKTTNEESVVTVHEPGAEKEGS